MASGVQSWDCAIKGPKEVYISVASVKEDNAWQPTLTWITIAVVDKVIKG